KRWSRDRVKRVCRAAAEGQFRQWDAEDQAGPAGEGATGPNRVATLLEMAHRTDLPRTFRLRQETLDALAEVRAYPVAHDAERGPVGRGQRPQATLTDALRSAARLAMAHVREQNRGTPPEH